MLYKNKEKSHPFKALRKISIEVTMGDNIVVHEILPLEIFEKILKFLDCKSLCQVRRICKQWKYIIDHRRLVQKALSKTSFIIC